MKSVVYRLVVAASLVNLLWWRVAGHLFRA